MGMVLWGKRVGVTDRDIWVRFGIVWFGGMVSDIGSGDWRAGRVAHIDEVMPIKSGKEARNGDL